MQKGLFTASKRRRRTRVRRETRVDISRGTNSTRTGGLEIQSCAEQSSHENPLEPDDYANPGRIFSFF